MTLRTRLALSATPAVAWTAQNALAGVSASGVAGEPSVTAPFVTKPDSLQTVLSLSAVPGWSTQRTRTMFGAHAVGTLGYPSVVWSSAIAAPSNAATGVLGNFFFEIDGAANATGIYGTGEAGAIAVNDTVWGSADLEGVAGTEGIGVPAITGYGSVILNGPQSASAAGQIFVGDILTPPSCEMAGFVGTINAAGFGSASLTGVQTIGRVAVLDFDALFVVRAIRLTAYMETT